MKKTYFVLSALALAASVSAVSASAAESNDFYTLKPAVVKEVPPTPEELYSGSAAIPQRPAPILQGLDIDFGSMIEIGEKVLQLIAEGRPVTNIQNQSVSVIPSGLSTWQQLNGWQPPVTKVYSVSVQNLMGMTVIDMRIKVSANWGGGLDGRGKFLANVTMVPSSVYVMWGFTCNVWADHQDPVNVGASDNPVAGLGFDIRWQWGNVVNMQTGTQDYFVSGDGVIKQLE